MYEKILVPLDGSAFAEQALPAALGLAGRAHGTLHLIHIPEELDQVDPELAGLDPDYPGALAEILESREASAGVEVVAIRREGEVADLITEYIEEKEIDLMVMATHGWGGITRLWLGSLPDTLIRRVDIPVMTIRPIEELATAESGRALAPLDPPEHILLPLDGSALAESVLDHLIPLGGEDLRVSLLQVIPGPILNDPASIGYALSRGPAELEEERSAALTYLEGIADRLIAQVGRVDTTVVTEPEKVDSILDYADQNGVDLIAVATHGRGGLVRRGLGSVADEILRTAELPVLVFRPSRP